MAGARCHSSLGSSLAGVSRSPLPFIAGPGGLGRSFSQGSRDGRGCVAVDSSTQPSPAAAEAVRYCHLSPGPASPSAGGGRGPDPGVPRLVGARAQRGGAARRVAGAARAYRSWPVGLRCCERRPLAASSRSREEASVSLPLPRQPVPTIPQGVGESLQVAVGPEWAVGSLPGGAERVPGGCEYSRARSRPVIRGAVGPCGRPGRLVACAPASWARSVLSSPVDGWWLRRSHPRLRPPRCAAGRAKGSCRRRRRPCRPCLCLFPKWVQAA